MHTPDKMAYLMQTLKTNPSELWRLLTIALTTARYRFLHRCVGKGTTVEPQTRIIHSANVRIGSDCLVKEGTYIRAGLDGKVIIGDRAALNAFCRIFGHGSVQIGEDTQIGPGTLITTTDHDYSHELQTRYKPVIIGKGVWIGGNAIILPGVNIGDFSVIGAGSVVTKDIPDRVVAIGVPARVIRKLEKPVDHSKAEEREYLVKIVGK